MKQRSTCGSSAGTLALVSLGCAKNAVDLQVRAGRFLRAGWTLSPDPDRADAVIVNTCSFIVSAREEAEAEIVRALELKRRGRYGRVIVTGCYPERYPEAVAKFPGVDEWSGVPQTWEKPPVPGFRLTGKAFAYLKIAEGCAHRCSYCAIPAIRGKFRSRPSADILAEAKALLKTGCRELNVVAQDPMLWREKREKVGGESRWTADGRSECKKVGGESRWTADGKNLTLTDLLWKLDKLKGDFWIRVLYSYPSEITDEFVIWLMTAKHAVPYVDMPIQHTVPEVLEKMNRKRAIEATLTAAEVLRDLVPDVTLRTTVMTGFPGETDLRFNRMRADLRRMQFDRLGAFAYSPEAGTKGAEMRGRPARAVAEAREKLVMDDAAALWKVKAKAMLGRTYRALVVAPGVARMASQAPDVDGVTYLMPAAGGRRPEVPVGTFVDVKLVRVRGFDFVGDVDAVAHRVRSVDAKSVRVPVDAVAHRVDKDGKNLLLTRRASASTGIKQV